MNDHELMFELSHPGRLNTLRLLKEKPHRLKDLSQALDLTSAEVSRHLGRLSNAQLVTKDGEGRYSLTPFGGIILHEVSNFKFLTKYNDYFSKHDFSVIPNELQGLNSISKCEIVEGTLEIMSMVGDLTKNATKYVRVMSDQLMRSMVELNIKKAKDGIDFKFIYPKGEDIPKEYRVKKGVTIEVRLLDNVPISMKLNEKIGGVVLPNISGKIDYEYAMMGRETLFHRWVKLLFDYYWERADPVY